ncbi:MULTISPECIES: sodium:proton antiporter [Micrococcaceae]|uniref:cation:proton antiporter n=1 Tax=Micrococcaceae TaxID=1268 RepID=UPI0016205AC5|nr:MULTISPECIES: sodium:proton antiporter [Micrococcaceae]MBB5750477.1 CPA1 family monovalent cation:H+ antiporter [Micrococcus sp. TA1]HRO28916.1 sodium:proton antiporter [Citricoccus sp.]HRO94091.1 sodium:proton antiporter [Citricoccus sp.]
MEDIALLAVAGVLIIVLVSLFAPRLGVAAPILLVLVGIGCSMIPGAPQILLDPEWILMIALPPILYSAAVNVPITDFRRDLGTISALSVFLVIASAFATGWLIWWLLPDIDLAAAVALGAVISPPDAVAATSIGKRLGLPPRLVMILEGEGLVNDATALVMLRTAIAATAGAVTFWGAIGDFAYAVSAGIVLGLLVGAGTVWFRSRIRQQPVLTTAISLTVPFLAYMPAENLHASGVIAVVTAGLLTGHQAPQRLSAADRLTDRTNWRTIQLLLENGVFLLMGFEITSIVADAEASGRGLWFAVGIAVLCTAVLVVVRIAFVVPLIAVLRARQRRVPQLARHLDAALESTASGEPPHPRTVARLRRWRADAHFLATQGLGWRGGAVLAWSGMRGVITLAAAQSLPADIPYRPELILIAFSVAILTLVVQGGTLPLLIRVLGIKGTDEEAQRREIGRLADEIIAARQAYLQNRTLLREDGSPFDPAVVERARREGRAATQALAAMVAEVDPDSQRQQYRELRRQLVEVEQAALLDARSGGTYSSHTLQRAQHFIDTEATRPG